MRRNGSRLCAGRVLAGIVTLLWAGGRGHADDWPQWRGPDRSGVSHETNLLRDWPKDGPRLIWTFSDAGLGYSGFAIVGERLYTMGARGDTEYVFALDIAAGKQLWSTAIGPTFSFKGNSWGDGPRGTPTFADGRLYALGGQGELVCVEAADGRLVWRVSLPRDLGGEISPAGGGPEKIGWGYCESPLVDGERVTCTPGGPGGTLAALDRQSGRVVWRSTALTDPATYSSMVPAEIGGVRQYVQMTDKGPVGVAAADGRLLWRYLHNPAYSGIVIPTPIVKGDLVYTTAGDGGGCDLVRVTADRGAFKAAKVYSNKNMVNQHGGAVLVGDRVYGYSEGKGWVCQDFASGPLIWSEKRRLGRGSIVCAGDDLYCHAEDDGTTVLVRTGAAKWEEHGRFRPPRESTLRAPNGKVWTHPVVANGRLYLRDQELIFCYDVRGH